MPEDNKPKNQKRVGFNEQGLPFPGVDPKTGERMAVSLQGLQAEFGIKEGVAKYYAICALEGEVVNRQTGETVRGRYFFDPNADQGYRPDLAVATLPEDARRQVAEILSTPQIKE